MWFAYEDFRKISTLEAVLGVTLQVRRCVNADGEGDHRPYRPESEGGLALPHHEFGLDVIAWMGARRYQNSCSLPEIHRDWQGQGVVMAARTVDHLLARYEEWVSVALEAPARRAALRQQGRLILALDGLQPAKGHEVLWVIREALVGLEGVPVLGVISDGQHAVRQAVAEVLPGVAHQLCQFHDRREAGRPIGEADRHAQ